MVDLMLCANESMLSLFPAGTRNRFDIDYLLNNG